MTPTTFPRAAAAAAIFAAMVFAGLLSNSLRVKATDDEEEGHESEIRRGLEIAPVPLHYDEEKRALVGLGSYIVNAQADCDGCHSAGPATEFAPGGNPYFGQPTKLNPATYLGGGRDFGQTAGPNSPHIISRNLTPDRTGLPEGGHTLAEFLEIMRTGVDMDQQHPNCSITLTTNCFPAPFRGDLLQVMPWFAHKHMTDHDLRAIYEYLSAIPCIAGPPAPSKLHNDCS